MRAFHNDPAIKATYLARVRAHRAADQLIHGSYWEHGKGCAVGCTIHGSSHAAYETELGIPRILARVEDNIFEALPPPRDLAWPEQFLEAIPVGADLSRVWPRFALALLSDVGQHVQQPQHARQKAAIEKVAACFQAWVNTGIKPATATAAAAAATADAAATYADDAAATVAATYAAAYAAATYADDAAATVAAAAAAYATYAAAAAAGAYAAAAARTDARVWQAATLLALLREAPQPAQETLPL